MKRDIELIRAILLALEAADECRPGTMTLDGYSEDQIGCHSYLIVKSGLAEGGDMSSFADKNPNWFVSHLTPAGHDFIDASRENAIWVRAKELAGQATVSVYLAVLADLAKKAVFAKLEQ